MGSMYNNLVVYLVAFLLVPTAILAAHPSEDGKVRFDGHNLQRVYIENEHQRRAVEALEFDVWSHESNVVIGENHILIPPGGDRVLSALGVAFLGTLIEDVQKIIDQQEKERVMKKLNGSHVGAEWSSDYHVFEEIVYEVKRLAGAHDFVDYVPSIGTTIQGRDIIALYLHGGPSRSKISRLSDIPADVPKIVFTGGQHAREWISPATVMYLVHELVKAYGSNTEVTDFLDKVAIVIVPVSNPDGYDFAWTTNRLWRKNRRQNTGGTYGVDLNRNWDTHWGGVGSSKTPSSDTYCGTKAFSEPESTAISQFVKGLGNVIAAIDWHSYSQLILRPWGWTQTPPKNNNFLTKLGANMQGAIRAVHNKAYTNEASWELYYTTGSAADWYYEKANITISYTIELRDTGRYGFVLPASEIIPTGQESWAATKLFIKTAIEELVD